MQIQFHIKTYNCLINNLKSNRNCEKSEIILILCNTYMKNSADSVSNISFISDTVSLIAINKILNEILTKYIILFIAIRFRQYADFFHAIVIPKSDMNEINLKQNKIDINFRWSIECLLMPQSIRVAMTSVASLSPRCSVNVLKACHSWQCNITGALVNTVAADALVHSCCQAVICISSHCIAQMW